MTDSQPRYPVRPPADGPAVILDLPRLWLAVEDEMVRRGMTNKSGTPEVKQLSELTGVDRTTLGRIRSRAKNGEITHGQRGGISVNAYLTLTSFVMNGRAAQYGKELRGGIPPYSGPGPDPTPEEARAAALSE